MKKYSIRLSKKQIEFIAKVFLQLKNAIGMEGRYSKLFFIDKMFRTFTNKFLDIKWSKKKEFTMSFEPVELEATISIFGKLEWEEHPYFSVIKIELEKQCHQQEQLLMSRLKANID